MATDNLIAFPPGRNLALTAAKTLCREGSVLKSRDLGPVKIGASARLHLFEKLFALAFAHADAVDPAEASRIEDRFNATLALLNADPAVRS